MNDGPTPYTGARSARVPGLVSRSPWYHGWNIIAVCLVVQALTLGLALSSYTFFAEQWIVDFDAARSRIALAIMLCSLGVSALGPFAGRIIDTAPTRLVMAGGLTIHATALLVISLARESWQVIAIFGAVVPFGLVFATSLPTQVLVARWFPTRRGFALGIAASGFSLGGMLMPPTVNMLIEDIGWRDTFQLFGWVTLAVILPLVLLIVRSRPDEAIEPASVETAGGAAVPTGAGVTAITILRTANFWILMAFAVLLIGALAGFRINLLAYAAERGISKMEAAGLLSGLAVAAVIANLIGGYLADRLEHRLLFAAIGFGSAAACVGLAFAHGFVPVAALFMVLGLNIGALVPLMGASLARLFGTEALGRAYGLTAAILALHAIFAPLIARAHEIAGNFTPVLLGCAISMACSGAIVLSMKYKALAPH